MEHSRLRWVLYLAALWCGLLLLGNLFWFYDYSDLFFGVLWEVFYVTALIAGLIHFLTGMLPRIVPKVLLLATVCDVLVWHSLSGGLEFLWLTFRSS